MELSLFCVDNLTKPIIANYRQYVTLWVFSLIRTLIKLDNLDPQSVQISEVLLCI